MSPGYPQVSVQNGVAQLGVAVSNAGRRPPVTPAGGAAGHAGRWRRRSRWPVAPPVTPAAALSLQRRWDGAPPFVNVVPLSPA